MRALLNKKQGIFLCLAFLFLSPGLLAVLFYKQPQLLQVGSTERGSFIKPALPVPAWAEEKPLWYVAVWAPQHCDELCKQSLQKVLQVRLALGRRLFEVRELLIIDKEKQSFEASLQHWLQEYRVETLALSEQAALPFLKQKPASPKIYILAPRPQGGHQMILTYPWDVESKDLFADIQHLLKTG